MSSSLENMFKCFLFNSVPPQWEGAAYPSLKPLASWFTDLRERVRFMRDWLEKGPPKTFWISGFFFPQVCCVVCIYRKRLYVQHYLLYVQLDASSADWSGLKERMRFMKDWLQKDPPATCVRKVDDNCL